MKESREPQKRPVIFDNDVLLTLVCSEVAQEAVIQWLGERCLVTTAVLDETKGSLLDGGLAASGLAKYARALALRMGAVEVGDLGESAADRMARIQQQLRSPGDSNRKHLGEAASIAAAVELRAIVATHDRDAIGIARGEGVATASVRQLLAGAQAAGMMEEDELDAAIEAMNGKGRPPPS